MKITSFLIATVVLIAGCRHGKESADAYGNFEATEVLVSAETNGRILRFSLTEGSEVEEGMEIALVDTTFFHLQKAELEANRESIRTRLRTLDAQNGILRQQVANLTREITRMEKLLLSEAGTQKQYDDLTGQVEVLNKQIAANNTQKASVWAELSVVDSKKALPDEQLKRCSIKSPLKGTLIEKFAKKGEMTVAGKPLAKIADLSVIRLKAYVSGSQLGSLVPGAACTVRVDEGEKGYRSYPGKITRISEKAEFTPKIIQTKEERVTLVYAVTIEVVNDGTLKSGMPGELFFTQTGE
ncbi:MAG: HlyD family efflux transporter periplasmic adaptor subunit [Prolixibacteraceae bacterium]